MLYFITILNKKAKKWKVPKGNKTKEKLKEERLEGMENFEKEKHAQVTCVN